MSNDIWRRDEIESPCVNICMIHPEARLCVGCHRTPEEIAAWGALSATERRRIMDDLAARAPQVKRRRGGRSRTRG